ncbi:MAG TPA: bifunctional [glutamate--ammonia ligase]-adenylyl-L-tyrosine phosphorylase/[glutamate--ammonia-ligase] adenylyltransferase [Methylomirabilota bacterium]|nr:bifunctional [glutamate--ammonia ligase]-adenylyl-L-tyrosine phosphorylase/[glutamate--ammonia-ligase] adenylyltransferase [Methylomirabilota bacterium]
MIQREWQRAIKASADPERAERYFRNLSSGSARELLESLSDESRRVLAQVLSGSRALSEQLLANPEWLDDIKDVELLKQPRQAQGINRDVAQFLTPALQTKEYSSAFRELRRWKQRQIFRIAARDLGGLTNVTELTRELSNLADACLQAVYGLCWNQLVERWGAPYHPDPDGKWQPTAFAVLGMGKLGGQELNYSSDADLLFVYTEDGASFKTPPRGKTATGKGIPNYQWFKLLCEMMINELTRLTPEGSLYRIDMRLRPEGKNGPLARSIGSYEIYYAQAGQTWERMMLIKTRPVAGNAALGAEFLEMIQPFRYPRSLAQNIPNEVALTKQRIENEVVKSGELDRNVKLGRGGIREIEFVAQTLQLIHAGRMPFLQGSQTLPTLEKLVKYELLDQGAASHLATAYEFLRNVEHRLQMEDNRQTHTIPDDRAVQERLARLMGFDTRKAFESALDGYRSAVRRIYDLHIYPARSNEDALPIDFDSTEKWTAIFENHSFLDPAKACRLAREFVHGPGFGHLSSRTIEAGMALIRQLLDWCPRKDNSKPYPEIPLSDPDRVLARLDSFVARYGARSTLFDAWNSNPSLFKLLVFVFDRSEFLAEVAIQTPDLIDTLEQTGHIRRKKTRAIMLEELGYGKSDKDQQLWLRRYFQAELMRIGLREIVGLSNLFQSEAELTDLAEAVLEYSLEVCSKRNGFKSPPFAVIGLGKLGGEELVYGSDLDVVFVCPDNVQNLPKLQKVAAELREMMTARTEHGATFELDARLRPDGEKGLLVNTLGSHREYYRSRAMLWEIQALTRARHVAGDEKTGAAFVKLATELADFSGAPKVAAHSGEWLAEIDRMRMRIETERTPTGKQRLAIKTGAGGLIDAEFIAQAVALKEGWHQPNTAKAIERGTGTTLLPAADGHLLEQEFLRLVQIEGILRRWSFESEATLPDDPAPQYRVAVRCGFRDAATFFQTVDQCRQNIRRVYERVFRGKALPAQKAPTLKKTISKTRRK